MLAAIVVHDDGRDGDRFGWVFGDPKMVPDCAALPVVAPAAVEQSNFVVRIEEGLPSCAVIAAPNRRELE